MLGRVLTPLPPAQLGKSARAQDHWRILFSAPLQGSFKIHLRIPPIAVEIEAHAAELQTMDELWTYAEPISTQVRRWAPYRFGPGGSPRADKRCLAGLSDARNRRTATLSSAFIFSQSHDVSRAILARSLPAFEFYPITSLRHLL